MEVLIAIFRKVEAGEVKTGYTSNEVLNNPVLSIENAVNLPVIWLNLKSHTHRREAMNDVQRKGHTPTLLAEVPLSSSVEKRQNNVHGRRSQRSSSMSSIRKQKSIPPIKQSTSLDKAIDELLVSTSDSSSNQVSKFEFDIRRT